MNEIACYAAKEAKGILEPFSYQPADLGPHDITIEITHCGVCHSDLHLINDDWGISEYPLVPGHEIIGTVKEIGDHVTSFKIGQRVGVGWQRSSCLNCEYCLNGNENLCSRKMATCVGHYGGFAKSIRVDSRFAFDIPENLDSSSAAPLLCGGITVYSPLRHFGVIPPNRVGVIGMGGLGHLAIRFAASMGCHVTLFSSSKEKEKPARELGAADFVSSSDPDSLDRAAGSVDFLLSTVNVDLDWLRMINCLRPDGKLCFVGIPPSNISIPAFILIDGRRTICGSPIGNRTMINEMFTFAARHNIGAQIEQYPLAEVNKALTNLKDNKVRYRAVLTM